MIDPRLDPACPQAVELAPDGPERARRVARDQGRGGQSGDGSGRSAQGGTQQHDLS
jgi:hypothetical protein